MSWRCHVLVWGDDGQGWTNTDRFNKVLASKDLRTKMLYELKRRQRGVIVLPYKKGMDSGRARRVGRAQKKAGEGQGRGEPPRG